MSLFGCVSFRDSIKLQEKRTCVFHIRQACGSAVTKSQFKSIFIASIAQVLSNRIPEVSKTSHFEVSKSHRRPGGCSVLRFDSVFQVLKLRKIQDVVTGRYSIPCLLLWKTLWYADRDALPSAQRDCAANFASEFTAQPAPEEWCPPRHATRIRS